MDKDTVEDKFRRAGTVPIHREKVGDYDIYISEGYSSPPHLTAQRLGIQPDEFPYGMYVTLYFLGKGEKLYFGSGNFYCAVNTRQDGRIEDVKRVAKHNLKIVEESRRERGVAN